MSCPGSPVLPQQFARLKFSLFVLPLVSLLLPAAVSAQQTFTGGGAVSLGSSQFTSSSSTLTISGATGSSIATIKVILNGVTSNGATGFSLQPTSFLLQAPNGGPSLVLLGSTGDGTDGDDAQDSGSGLSSVTITIQDGATKAPDGNPTIWQHTGSVTVKPSSYFAASGQTPPLGTQTGWPQSDGSATLNGRFAGTGINNGDKWTLTIINCCSVPTPVSVNSWGMVVTYATTTPTTTAVSSSLNPAFTGNSVTLNATISTSSGTPTGTVAFTDNGTTISGCGAVAVSGGVAQCSTSMAQGYNSINAAYSGGGGFGPSSGSLTQLMEVHPTQSGNTWCNNTSFSAPLNGTSIAYPAMIPVSGYTAGSTVGNVTLELESVTQGAVGAGIDGEFLLVAPGGLNNLDFLDTAFNTQGSGVNLFISDSSSLSPNYGTPVSNDTYLPFDGNTQTIDTFPPSNSPIVDSNIPLVPATINFAAPHGHTNSLTLQQAFSGAPANGDWALYATASNGTDALTVGGWCVTLDVNSGVATTTTLGSSRQDAFAGTNVTLTATVLVNGTSTPVTSGTVQFKDETTGAVLASAAALNGSGQASVTTSTLAEGDHKILASYSGTGTFNTSFTTMYQRIDSATTISSVSSNAWQFCNTGKITIPMGTNGAETPNPSNIFVTNLPGTLKTATLTLEDFSILVGDELDNTASLVVGPTGNALDFFSNTAAATIGDQANAGNYTFADAAGALVSSGSGNINPGTYKPTSYVGTANANDVFTADPGGFYTLPGSFGYSASRGASTFASEFANTNANGAWSLYFNSPNANANGTGAANGWCLNLTENLPAVTVGLSSASTFTQGGSGAYLVLVQNNGTGGPTGDPTGTNPMTVTDVLNPAFTFASGSGTGWSCSAAGQTVTCTNDSAIADNGGAYPDLTINVSVSGTASGVIGNHVSASGAGASSTNSSTDNVTIDVPPAFTSAASTTFTVGTAGSFSVTATGNPAPTFSEAGALPTGVTLTSAGALGGTPAAGTGDTYPIVITAANGSTNATQNFTLTVNQAPTITSANSTTFSVGTLGSFSVTASGNPAPTFSETGALPTGVTLSSAGVLSGTPATGTGGTYPFTINATNGIAPDSTQSFTLTIDEAPAVTSANNFSFTVGGSGAFIVSASGFPAPTLSETGALPNGISLTNIGNGRAQLSGAPAAGTGGSYPLTLTATNGITPDATQSFALTVKQNVAFTSTASTTFIVGTLGSFNVTTTGFPAPSFTETGALPSGVTLTDNGNGTASLAGTPAAGTGGSYSISIHATNGFSTPSQSFTLIVDQAPAITSTNAATFTAGAAGTFSVTTTGNPTSALSETGALPSGVTFTDNGDGTATLAGTAAAANSFPITITANNGVSPNAGQSFTLTVNPPLVQLTATSNPAAGGTITPASGSLFFQGTVVPITATPAAGYTFIGWTSSPDPVATATSASTTITMNASESVTAQFAPSLVVNTANDDPGTSANCAAQPTPGTTTNADTCSLRDALLNAASSGAANISFDSTVFATAQTITLTNGTLNVPLNTIVSGATSGSGPTLTNLVTVNGNGASTVFTVNSGVTGANLNGLTISNGGGNTFGGGISNSGTLVVASSTISGNTATQGGAGIYNNLGTLTLNGSTISGNSIANSPGGATGGGILNTGTLTVLNSTFIANTAVSGGDGVGGAIANNGGIATVSSSTVFGNSSDAAGGGIYFNGGTNKLGYNILSGNSAPAGPNVFGAYQEVGGDLKDVTSLGLAPLGNYGGPTQTLLPLPGSPVICGTPLGDGTIIPNLSIDQRGDGLNALCTAPFIDSGAVQTHYALAFTTQPPSTGFSSVPLAPAPVVQLTESGAAAPATITRVVVTDSAGLLVGTTSIAPSAGSVTFSNLIIPSPTTNDRLTATLALNSSLNLTAQAEVTITVTTNLAQLIVPPAPGTVLNPTEFFSWTTGSGVTQYAFWLGTTSGSHDIYNSGHTTSTSTGTITLPTNGQVIYAELFSLIGGAWRYTNYTFFAAGPPAILSPAPSSVLGLNQTFTWSPGTGSTMSELQLGTTGPGSSNIYDSGPTTATSAFVQSVPANSATVFARLRSFIGGSWQNIDYTYTEPPPPVKSVLINPTQGAVLGPSATFTWTTGTDVTQYALWLGTTGPGSFDLYNSGHTSATSTGTITLPTNGQEIFAALFSYIGGVWKYATYTFYAAGPPAILSPTPGGVLGLSQTFTWSPGTGSTMSELQLGTTGLGSSNLYDSGPTTATSAFVASVPAKSATVFARLRSFIGGSWQNVDYTYTESAPPVKSALISPTPGTVLGSSATFTWTPGTGVTMYDLALGTTGFGSSDIYTTGHTTAHSTGAIPLPTNGVTVYAQLYSYVGGTWLYSQYTFTEQ